MSRARMPIAVVALLAGGLALGPGGAAAQDPTPTPTPTPTPEPEPVVRTAVSLTAAPTVVRLTASRPQPVTLSGALAGTASVRDRRVQLIGYSSAFGSTTVRRTARTDGAGRFSFTVRPQANASYRVRILPGQGLRGASPRRAVDVFPRVALRSRRAGRGALRLTVDATAPARVPLAGGETARLRAGGARRAVFYLRLRGERRYRRVGTSRLSRPRCASTCTRTATFVVRSRRVLDRATTGGACFRGIVFRGLGDTTPCGAARRRF